MISLTTPQAQANLASANVASINAGLGLQGFGNNGLAHDASKWNCLADSFNPIGTDQQQYSDRLVLEPQGSLGREPEHPATERRHLMIAVKPIDPVMPKSTQFKYKRSASFRNSNSLVA